MRLVSVGVKVTVAEGGSPPLLVSLVVPLLIPNGNPCSALGWEEVAWREGGRE